MAVAVCYSASARCGFVQLLAQKVRSRVDHFIAKENIRRFKRHLLDTHLDEAQRTTVRTLLAEEELKLKGFEL
jgi:hypothetical protein